MHPKNEDSAKPVTALSKYTTQKSKKAFSKVRYSNHYTHIGRTDQNWRVNKKEKLVTTKAYLPPHSSKPAVKKLLATRIKRPDQPEAYCLVVPS